MVLGGPDSSPLSTSMVLSGPKVLVYWSSLSSSFSTRCSFPIHGKTYLPRHVPLCWGPSDKSMQTDLLQNTPVCSPSPDGTKTCWIRYPLETYLQAAIPSNGLWRPQFPKPPGFLSGQVPLVSPQRPFFIRLLPLPCPVSVLLHSVWSSPSIMPLHHTARIPKSGLTAFWNTRPK